MKGNIERKIILVMVIIFLAWFFWPVKNTFVFYIGDADETIDGEVIFDNVSIGYTKGGKIKIPDLESYPEEFIFKGIYNKSSFKFVYEFPDDYDFYSEFPFRVSKDELSRFTSDDFSNTGEIHFTHMPITYNIYVDSSSVNAPRGDDSYEVDRIKWALQIIEDSTDNLVQFKEVEINEDPDIIINGYPPRGEDSDINFITEGLAGPIEMIDEKIIEAGVDLFASDVSLWAGSTSQYIEGGWLWEVTDYELRESISWQANDCKDFPNTEIHELAHAFGFGHLYDNSYSIMAPIKHRIQTCKTDKIDEEIVSCMKYIYSNGELEGNCSNLNMYPWSVEEEEEIIDFKWDYLSVTYSVIDCNDRQIRNIQKAEEVIEKYVGYELFDFKAGNTGKIIFRCQDSFDTVLLNKETDFWDTGVYFPASQPSFVFNNEGKIQKVDIILFAQERRCGGIEVHELLHSIGLREHYGHWMTFETEMCDVSSLVIGNQAIDKVKELYGLE